MKRKAISSIILLFCAAFVHAQEVGTGLIFDDEEYESEYRIARGLNFADLDTANSFSLRCFAPEAGHQGKSNSCVAWASGYAALTISNRVAGQNISPRSPRYVFNQIVERKDCNQGTQIGQALKFLQIKGDCALEEFDPEPCDSVPSLGTHSSATAFKIKDYYTLFGNNDVPGIKIKQTIVSLTSKKPVIVGMKVYKNLHQVGADGLYVPDTLSGYLSGHAMCVVGFDKTKRQFEVLNSWGTKWGKDGYCYISFDDFARDTKYGYFLNAETTRSLNFSDSKAELSGEFLFRKLIEPYDKVFRYKEVTTILKDGIYEIEGGSKVGNHYKLIAQNARDNTFIYIFSFKPDLTSELLFPKFDKETPNRDVPVITSSKVKVIFPEDPDNVFTTDKMGNDYLCILYSSKRIDDIKTLVKQIESFSGTFSERLQSVLGSMLIPSEEIQYANDLMKVTVSSENGYVAPIILKVNVTN